jgi:hypothetical protein
MTLFREICCYSRCFINADTGDKFSHRISLQFTPVRNYQNIKKHSQVKLALSEKVAAQFNLSHRKRAWTTFLGLYYKRAQKITITFQCPCFSLENTLEERWKYFRFTHSLILCPTGSEMDQAKSGLI